MINVLYGNDMNGKYETERKLKLEMERNVPELQMFVIPYKHPVPIRHYPFCRQSSIK